MVLLLNPFECLKYAILASMNDQVDSYNNTILNLINTKSYTYIATNSFKKANNVSIEPSSAIFDYAATHHFFGLPPYALFLKKNSLQVATKSIS